MYNGRGQIGEAATPAAAEGKGKDKLSLLQRAAKQAAAEAVSSSCSALSYPQAKSSSGDKRKHSVANPEGPQEVAYKGLQKERQNNQGPSKLAVLALEAKWKAAEGGAVLKGGKAVLKDARSPTEGVMVPAGKGKPGNYQMLPPGSAGPPEADGSPNPVSYTHLTLPTKA